MFVSTPRALTRNAFVLGVRLPAAVLCLALVVADRACGESQEALGVRRVRQQIEAEQQALTMLQQRFVQMVPLALDDKGRDAANLLREEIARRTARLQELKRSAADAENEAAERERQTAFENLQAVLLERENELRQMHERLAAMEREREGKPIDDAVFKIFTLKFLEAQAAADTVTSIFGGTPLRIAADRRANALVVAGDEKTLKIVEALMQQLDVDRGELGAPVTTPGAQPESPRSLSVRIFWVADGLAEDEGREMGHFLPDSVIDAVDKLGVVDARIVGQTANTISRDGNPKREVMFRTSMPALIFKTPAELNVSGSIKPIRNDRAEMEMSIEILGQSNGAALEGSIVAPLGHFMVLGTANSVTPDLAAVDRQALVEQAGREPFRPGRRGGGGFGGPDEQPPLTYKTSRFAFVVQVVDATSFAPEE